jgi:hypothetical protein
MLVKARYGALKMTRLHWACSKGRLERTAELLDWKSALEALDADGWTPLLHACRKGHVEVARELLRRGANFEVKSAVGRSPLHERVFAAISTSCACCSTQARISRLRLAVIPRRSTARARRVSSTLFESLLRAAPPSTLITTAARLHWALPQIMAARQLCASYWRMAQTSMSEALAQ